MIRLVLFSFMFLASAVCYSQTSIKRIDSLLFLARMANDVDSSNLITDVTLKESKLIGYTNGITSAILIKGVNLYNKGEFDKALKVTFENEELIFNTKDNVKISHLLALRGNCYNNLFFFTESIKSLQKAMVYAKKIEDNDSRYFNIGRIYRITAANFRQNPKIRNVDSALYYQKKSFDIQSKIKNKERLYVGRVIQAAAIGELFLEKENLDSAKYYFDLSNNLAKKANLLKYSVEALLGLGHIDLQLNRPERALTHYLKAKEIAIRNENPTDVKLSYEALAKTYEKMGNTAKSNEYLKKYGIIADSLVRVSKLAATVSSDYLMKEKESVFSDIQLRYIIIILCVVLLLALAVFIIVKLNNSRKRMLTIHNDRLKTLYDRLDQSLSITAPEKVDEEELKNVISLAVANDPTFLIKFKELQPHFFEQLLVKAPSLVTSDLLICGQLRLGFYTKEIARYTKTSVRSVESKKYRIRKKLEIPASDDINVWMMSL
jgi:tetratricopeptide (TPR) repeat protein